MKQFIAAFALSIAAAGSVAAQPVSLNALSQYLSDLGTVETTFTQVASDGTLSTGRLYIQRPGRMRFEYDPPNDALVIAGGGTLSVFDPVSNEPPLEYPLRSTPLNLILARQVDLARSDLVQAHTGDATATRVLAQDPDRPEIGTIELVFSSNPVELRQWVINDPDAGATTVILGTLEERDSLSSFLFSSSHEAEQRGLLQRN